ncbi:MAG: DUF5689 domain-containing protein [Bacteroidota bacterium]
MKYAWLNFWFVCAVWMAGCTQKWDQPPPLVPGSLAPNTTIRELRQLHFPGNTEQILHDWILEGVVVANDSLDNFYKTIVVQDATGGISIKIDATNLYLMYPVGLQVFIRLRGCWLGDYGGLLQLGAGSDRSDSTFPRLLPIPVPLLKQIIVAGTPHQKIEPREVTIGSLSDSFQNCLVRLSQVELIPSDTSRTWADALNQQAVNHVLTSCNGGSLYVRTSGYARFASAKTPRGNGTILGIYTVFGWEKQLVIRDTADVDLDGLRCSGSGFVTRMREDFDLLRPGSVLNLPGWKNIAEEGGRPFFVKSAGNERFASIEAFACGEPRVISWLISPTLSLNGIAGARLRFETRDGFDNGANLRVLVSSNYNGSNTPSTARWTTLSATIAGGNTRSQSLAWTPSGSLSLSAFRGNIVIAFRYEGSDTGTLRRTTTFHLDRIEVLSN